MNDKTTRQNYLMLTSKLYELASQFTREELRSMREFAQGENSKLTSLVIDVLLVLHNGDSSEAQSRYPSNERAPSIIKTISSRNRDLRRERLLKDLLMSKELFTNASKIAASIPNAPELRPKESREKYVNRVVDGFRKLPSAERDVFMARLQKDLTQHSAGSFVTKWSKLIRDL